MRIASADAREAGSAGFGLGQLLQPLLAPGAVQVQDLLEQPVQACHLLQRQRHRRHFAGRKSGPPGPCRRIRVIFFITAAYVSSDIESRHTRIGKICSLPRKFWRHGQGRRPAGRKAALKGT